MVGYDKASLIGERSDNISSIYVSRHHTNREKSNVHEKTRPVRRVRSFKKFRT